MAEEPIPSFKGILPQLTAAVIALTNQRDQTGLWSDDAVLSSKGLQALEAYRMQVETSEGLEQATASSTKALAERLSEISDEVAAAGDLGGGFGDNLRGMCAAWLVLRVSPDPTIPSILAQCEPSLLKLLDYGTDVATGLGDLDVAREVLETIPLLESETQAASAHAKPWLEFVVRRLLNPDRSLPRYESLQLNAVSILLRALHGSRIEPTLRQVWSVEAPKMSNTTSGEAPEKTLPRIAGDILKGYSPSSLGEECLALEIRELLGADETDQVERLAASLTGTVIGFSGLPVAGRARLVRPLAWATVLLSSSGFGEVTVFGTTDTNRIMKALALDKVITSGKSMVVSKSKYRALEVLAYLLIVVLGLVIAWYNPGYALLIVPLAGAVAAVTWKVLGRKD